jgi:hypothetical protein
MQADTHGGVRTYRSLTTGSSSDQYALKYLIVRSALMKRRRGASRRSSDQLALLQAEMQAFKVLEVAVHAAPDLQMSPAATQARLN